MPRELETESRRDRWGGGGERPPRRFARTRRVRIGTSSGARIEAALAERFASRLLGLAWLRQGAAPALLIPRCRSVHTFGMRFAIDVLFVALPADLGRLTARALEAEVLAVRSEVGPRRLAFAGGSRRRDAPIGALELAAGGAARLGVEPYQALSLEALDGFEQASERRSEGDHD